MRSSDPSVPSKHFENLFHGRAVVGEEEERHREVEERQADGDGMNQSTAVVGGEFLFAEAFFEPEGVVMDARDADGVGETKGEEIPAGAVPESDEDEDDEDGG